MPEDLTAMFWMLAVICAVCVVLVTVLTLRTRTKKGLSGNVKPPKTPLDHQRMSPAQVSAKTRAAGLLNKALDAAAPEAEAALSWSKALESLSHAGITAPKSTIDKLKDNNELVSRAMKALPA